MVCGGKCLQAGAENSHPKMVSPEKSCVSPKNTPYTPLHLMQDFSCEPLLLYPSETPHTKLRHYQSLTSPLSLQKKVFEKKLHFLHLTKKMPIKPELFRCRIGCRILFSLAVILHQQHRFCLISRVNRENGAFYTNSLRLLKKVSSVTFSKRQVMLPSFSRHGIAQASLFTLVLFLVVCLLIVFGMVFQ